MMNFSEKENIDGINSIKWGCFISLGMGVNKMAVQFEHEGKADLNSFVFPVIYKLHVLVRWNRVRNLINNLGKFVARM